MPRMLLAPLAPRLPSSTPESLHRTHRRHILILFTLGMLLGFSLGLALRPRPAEAHALPVRSQPQKDAILPSGPKQVQIWFDEGLIPSGSTIKVYNASRQEFDLGNSRVDPHDSKHLTVSLKSPLPNGNYTVAWLSISADDGHHVHGTFTFSVGLSTLPGAGSGSSSQGIPSAAAVADRWLAFLGLIIPAGWFLLGLLGLPLSAARHWLPLTGALVAFIADLALIPVEAFAPGPGIPGQSLALVPAELPVAWRWGLLTTALLLLAVILAPRWQRRRRAAAVIGALLATAAVLGLAFESHAAARANYQDLALGVESLHLVTVAFWLGAVVQLAALPADSRIAHQPTLRRFSHLALGLAPVAIISGAGLASLTFPSVASVWTSGYGRILLIKAALVVGIFAFAYRNHHAIATGLRRVSAFARSLRAEVVFGIFALLAATTMGLWTPPQPKPVVTLQIRGQAGTNLVAHVNLTPVSTGPNRLEAWLTNEQNQPVAGISSATADLTELDRQVAITELPLRRLADGHWLLQGAGLTVQGWWEIQVHFQSAKLPPATGQFVTIIPDPLLVGPPPSRASQAAARRLFQQATTTLGHLTSMRENQDLSDGVGNSITTVETEEAPDKFVYQTGAGTRSIAIGQWQYFQSGNGAWTRQQRPDVFHFPATVLTYYSGATEFTLGRQQVVGGENCQILSFYAPNQNGRGQAWYAWWVGTKTHLIRQEAMVADHHYMLVRYDNFNKPVPIAPPQASAR